MSESRSDHPTSPADPTAEISVRSLIIPLSGIAMVLPNTAVAEVAEYKAPQPVAEAPLWLRGMMLWRGRSIPLIAFEQLLAKPAGVGGVHARAVVCNTLNGNRTLPFIAILAQGIPRLQEIKADVLEAKESEGDEVQAGLLVRLAGVDAVIPDLDVLERMLLQIGVKAG